MAGIIDVQNKYLQLMMQNYPEYKAGLYTSTPNLTFDELFNRPTGPLYDVQPTSEQLESPTGSFFDEGDVDVATYAPKGPLYDVDPERSIEIMQSLDPEAAEKFAESFSFHDDGSMSQNIYDPGIADSYSEWQAKPDSEINMSPVPLNIKSTPQEGSWAHTYGPVTSDITGNIQAGTMHVDPNLLEFVGTKPTSPRNEQKIDASSIGLGMQYPKDLNKFATDVVAHEYGHNALDMPGFKNIRSEVMGTNINKLFTNPKSVEYLPSVYERGIYKAGAKEDMSDYDKEEIFNRLLDMERIYGMQNNFSGILANINLQYMNKKLGPFSQGKGKWGTDAMNYYNLMKPTADKYFTEVERQGRMGPINKAKLQVGMPENLSFDTGAGNIPMIQQQMQQQRAPISVPVPAHISGGGGGGQKGSMPTGTAGRNPWGRADGGLINLYRYGGVI